MSNTITKESVSGSGVASRNITKAAVIGSGVMGSGIAAHLANAGIPCLARHRTRILNRRRGKSRIVAGSSEGTKPACGQSHCRSAQIKHCSAV